ncbi:MAG: hypothetical protein DRI44_05100 [Chlamydiae bacterium]|nr:MAG: hypothetical protein DRI44_05100 [Chlamydiota bacterium]
MTTFTFSFWYNVPVKTFKNKKRSYEKKTKNNLTAFFAVVLPLFAIALWAFIFSINSYNQTRNYRENEITVVINSFADSLSYWCIANFTAEFEENPANINFVKKSALLIIMKIPSSRISRINLFNVIHPIIHEL